MNAPSIKLSPDVCIPLTKFASQGTAILGLRGSGKSYSATYLAEQLMEAKIPFTAFDPIGVWRNLKIAAKGPGFPVVVVGDDADLPLNPDAIPDIVRASMREGMNLVIDLYSMALSKAAWRRIVEGAVSIMLHENKPFGLRQIFLEEAAEFCPQVIRNDQAAVYSVIDKLARMGGNASLGFTLINQRAEAVNKEVLENCDMIFLHKQRGKNSMQSLGKWLKSINPEKEPEITKSLPHLKAGECWVLTSDSDEPQFVKMPQKRSFHPDRESQAIAKPVGKPVDVSRWIEQLSASIKKHEQPNAKSVPVFAYHEKPVLNAEDRKGLENLVAEIQTLNRRINEISFALKELPIAKLGNAACSIDHMLLTQFPAPTDAHARRRSETPPIMEAAIAAKTSPAKETLEQASGVPTGGRQRMLTALAQRPQGLTSSQLGVRTGMSSKGGTFGKYLGELRTAGYIEGGRDRLRITEAGLQALGAFTPLPTGQRLLDHWLKELGGGKARILEVLAHNYPNELSGDQVGEQTGMAMTGGTFGKYIGELKTLELITGNRSRLRASGEFFV